ncbi:hypothetical protein EEB14_30565 [Rhodococcus sp. WS4]|nr:hypothetical protein EEB14_30565 [Rhodococcus sp. WS4]
MRDRQRATKFAAPGIGRATGPRHLTRPARSRLAHPCCSLAARPPTCPWPGRSRHRGACGGTPL